jgi:hypothetical protein
LHLPDDGLVVNGHGAEPLIAPALVSAVAELLTRRPDASMSTAASLFERLLLCMGRARTGRLKKSVTFQGVSNALFQRFRRPFCRNLHFCCVPLCEIASRSALISPRKFHLFQIVVPYPRHWHGLCHWSDS